MNSITERHDSAGVTSSAWMVPGTMTALAVLALLLIFFETAASIVSIWARSETFAHGYLIFPISLYLIWNRRAIILQQVPQVDYRALLVLAGLGFIWLLARLADVLVVQQLCLVAMIPATVWSMLGWPVVRVMAFPLGFLIFAVPMGEFLIPWLMEITADMTVKMIELTGIPIYREGYFFSIPSGNWSVVEGCSGIRYLIASVTLGCLYAYLTFHSLSRRIIFIVLSAVVPIFANGMRAYMIVMIAHLSDMKLAHGVDHYIYGWVFFGFIMLLMFWIGSFWREPETVETSDKTQASQAAFPAPSPKSFLLVTLAIVVIAGIWPVRAAFIAAAEEKRSDAVQLTAPQGITPWKQTTRPLTQWEPDYLEPDAKLRATYTDGTNAVELYLMYYRTQEQDSELINSQNILIRQKHPVWSMLDEIPVNITTGGRKLRIWQARLRSSRQAFLVWRWNWVAGIHTTNAYLAKLLEAKDKLLDSVKDAAGIIIITPYDELEIPKAKQQLQDFIDRMFPSIEQTLQKAEKS